MPRSRSRSPRRRYRRSRSRSSSYSSSSYSRSSSRGMFPSSLLPILLTDSRNRRSSSHRHARRRNRWDERPGRHRSRSPHRRRRHGRHSSSRSYSRSRSRTPPRPKKSKNSLHGVRSPSRLFGSTMATPSKKIEVHLAVTPPPEPLEEPNFSQPGPEPMFTSTAEAPPLLEVSPTLPSLPYAPVPPIDLSQAREEPPTVALSPEHSFVDTTTEPVSPLPTEGMNDTIEREVAVPSGMIVSPSMVMEIPRYLEHHSVTTMQGASFATRLRGGNWKVIHEPALSSQGPRYRVYRVDGFMPGQPMVALVDPRAPPVMHRNIRGAKLRLPHFKVSVHGQPSKFTEIILAGLATEVTEDFLLEECEHIGRVRSLRLGRVPETKEHLGIAKVRFYDAEVAKRAVVILGTKSLYGSALKTSQDSGGTLFKEACKIRKEEWYAMMRGMPVAKKLVIPPAVEEKKAPIRLTATVYPKPSYVPPYQAPSKPMYQAPPSQPSYVPPQPASSRWQPKRGWEEQRHNVALACDTIALETDPSQIMQLFAPYQPSVAYVSGREWIIEFEQSSQCDHAQRMLQGVHFQGQRMALRHRSLSEPLPPPQKPLYRPPKRTSSPPRGSSKRTRLNEMVQKAKEEVRALREEQERVDRIEEERRKEEQRRKEKEERRQKEWERQWQAEEERKLLEEERKRIEVEQQALQAQLDDMESDKEVVRDKEFTPPPEEEEDEEEAWQIEEQVVEPLWDPALAPKKRKKKRREEYDDDEEEEEEEYREEAWERVVEYDLPPVDREDSPDEDEEVWIPSGKKPAKKGKKKRKKKKKRDLGVDKEDAYFMNLAIQQELEENAQKMVEPYQPPPLPSIEERRGHSARTDLWTPDRKVIRRRHVTVDESSATNDSGRAHRAAMRQYEKTLDITSDTFRFGALQARQQKLRFARSHVHQFGLFAIDPIPAKEMVIEYIGELIRPIVADAREKKYGKLGLGDYFFRINDEEILDATCRANLARFINHSCEPNCFSQVVQVDGVSRIVVYALRDIQAGEELFYDYKFPIELDSERIPCHCGAKNCRGYLN